MDRLKKKKKAMSLRQAFMVYLFTGVALEALLLLLTFQGMAKVMTCVNDYGEETRIIIENGVEVRVPLRLEQTTGQKIVDRMVHIGSVALPILYSCVTLYATSKLYYDHRLKPALERLGSAVEKIEANDLDFTVQPVREDELGALCLSFEHMRKALHQNNQEMWRLMEERKRLNAAFAHDLRTPLTVLRGYNDFLSSYLPTGKLSEEKVLTTLSVMDRNMERLQHYVETMNQVEALETIQISPAQVDIEELIQTLRGMGEILQKQSGIQVSVRSMPVAQSVCIDEAAFMQVAENLFSNGIRYARTQLLAELKQRDGFLALTVSDDGAGFDEVSIREAARPYYKDRGERGEGHLGMGLHICRLLCEKHGGQLRLSNRTQGGAQVSAVFSTKTEKEALSR